jgi:hypothetical protein
MNRLLMGMAVLALMACKREALTFRDGDGGFKVQPYTFNYMSAKIKLDFESEDNKLSAVANMRIHKDSIIWISVSPGLGVEVVRVLIDRGGIQAYDKLKKEYYHYDYKELERSYGFEVNYDLVESVFLGNLLYEPSKREVDKKDKQFVFEKRNGGYGIVHYIGVNSHKLERLEVSDPRTNNAISVNYGDFRKVENQVAPQKIKARIHHTTERRKNTKLDIEYKTTVIQTEPLTFPFNVPARYTRK